MPPVSYENDCICSLPCPTVIIAHKFREYKTVSIRLHMLNLSMFKKSNVTFKNIFLFLCMIGDRRLPVFFIAL